MNFLSTTVSYGTVVERAADGSEKDVGEGIESFFFH